MLPFGIDLASTEWLKPFLLIIAPCILYLIYLDAKGRD